MKNKAGLVHSAASMPRWPDIDEYKRKLAASLGGQKVSTSRPPKPKGRPKPTKEEKLKYALDKGSYAAERSTQELLWQVGQGGAEVVSGKFDHRVWWILLVAAKKIVNDGLPVFEKPEEVQMAESDLKRFPMLFQPGKDYVLPSIEFDDIEFRKILNKPDLTSDDIESVVTNLAKLVIKTPKKFEVVKVGEDKERVSYSQCIGAIAWAQVEGMRIREKGRWKGRMVRKYRIYFNSMPGLAFYQNIVTHRFTLINNWRGFMGLNGPEQTLFLSISWREDIPAILTFNQIVKIVGWERWDADNHARQVERVEGLLDGLKKSGWIGSWQRLQGEVYKLTKTDFNRLPKPE
ncbi:MAG: hypothetical protein ABFD52_00700 [Acidobacteriota bacterium]